jgi:hypothetical protein
MGEKNNKIKLGTVGGLPLFPYIFLLLLFFSYLTVGLLVDGTDH